MRNHLMIQFEVQTGIEVTTQFLTSPASKDTWPFTHSFQTQPSILLSELPTLSNSGRTEFIFAIKFKIEVSAISLFLFATGQFFSMLKKQAENAPNYIKIHCHTITSSIEANYSAIKEVAIEP